MEQLVVLLPAVLVLVLIAGSVRLAARILGLKNVRWKLCFVFALVLLVVTVVRKTSGLATDGDMPRLAGFVLGTGLTLATGTWLFGKYVVDSAGLALGWKAGAKLTACAFLIVCTPALLVVTIGSMVQG